MPRLLIAITILAFPSLATADAPKAPTFEADVLPVLNAHCLQRHGGVHQKNGLDLRTLDTALKGGKSGAVVVPGKPDESLLWKKLVKDEMPKTDNKVSDANKKIIRAWIEAGAKGAEKTAGATATRPAQKPAFVTSDFDVSWVQGNMYWLSEYPDVMKGGEPPRCGYRYYRVSPDYSELEFTVGPNADAVHKVKELGAEVWVSLTDGMFLDKKPTEKDKVPVRPFVGDLVKRGDDMKNYVPSLDPRRGQGGRTGEEVTREAPADRVTSQARPAPTQEHGT